jgi:DNA topoisomerase-2
MLEAMVVGTDKSPALLKDYKEYHTDTTVHFVVTLTEKGKEAVKREGLEKVFKMTAKINTSNMVMFDPQGKIKKYATPEDVVDDFYDVRLDYYHRRKAFLVNELTNQHDKLSNQARFIQMIIKKELVLNNRKKAAIVAELREKEFRPFPKVAKAQVIGGGADEGVEEEEVEDAEGGLDSDYDYLLSMALSSLTAEKVDKLMKERDEKEDELTALLRLSATDLWSADLDVFSAQWEVSCACESAVSRPLTAC